MKIKKISYCGRRNFERFNLPPVLTQLEPEKKITAKPEKKEVKKKIDVNRDEELFGGLVEENNFIKEVNYDE